MSCRVFFLFTKSDNEFRISWFFNNILWNQIVLTKKQQEVNKQDLLINDIPFVSYFLWTKYCNGFIQTIYIHNFKALFRYVIQRNSEKKENENFMLSLFKFQNLNRKEKWIEHLWCSTALLWSPFKIEISGWAFLTTYQKWILFFLFTKIIKRAIKNWIHF